jgi:arylsulfatase A-like enzyme
MVKRSGWIYLLLGILLQGGSCRNAAGPLPTHPNVLLIICDDLNDFVEGWGGHPQARTPHIARLAAEGVSFLNAHSNDPVCAPCRASLFTGIYPHTSGLYSFERWDRNPTLQQCKTMMELFRENGYRVLGTGKLLHHEKPELWDAFGHERNHGPWPFNGMEERPNAPWDGLVAHPAIPLPFGNNPYSSFGPLSRIPAVPPEGGLPGYTGWWDGYAPFYYVSEEERDLMPDEKSVDWIISKLKELEEGGQVAPFFMALGFNRPHTPLYAPDRFFEMFPLDQLSLPPYLENDLEDCARGLVKGNAYPKYNYKRLMETYGSRETGLRQYLQAYLACIAFVDDQLGKVMDALEQSSFADNTIVIFTSDHGYHLGEKDWLFKHTLWEESTRIPLIVKAPGLSQPGGTCHQPVSLIDIYPTLVDLCHLEGNNMKSEAGNPLEGHSLSPLLQRPGKNQWSGPEVALSAILSNRIKEGENIPMKAADQHFSVRSLHWRYSLANDGSEELYDHRSDPNEWTNLAGDPETMERQEALHQRLLEITGMEQ